MTLSREFAGAVPTRWSRHLDAGQRLWHLQLTPPDFHNAEGKPQCLCLAVEDSDSGGAGLEDALEQTSERHGSGGMPAVELLREGRELFVQARCASRPSPNPLLAWGLLLLGLSSF